MVICSLVDCGQALGWCVNIAGRRFFGALLLPGDSAESPVSDDTVAQNGPLRKQDNVPVSFN